jgi:RNA polymerase sigma-70 factor (ECF subfamily)
MKTNLKQQGMQQVNSFYWDAVRNIVSHSVSRVLVGNFEFWKEDVVQDIIVKIIMKPTLFDESKGSFNSWLSVVARNAALDFIRVNKNYFSVIDLVSPFLMEEEDIDKEALFILLEEAIFRLGKKEKQLISLKFYEQKSGREIASVMNIPEKQVPIYIQRAKQKVVQIAQQLAA